MTTVVEELSCAAFADPDSFRDVIAKSGEPIILRGLCSGWPATQAAAQSWEELSDYLLGLDSGAVAQAFLGPPSIAGRYYYSDDFEGFNFERRDMRLSDAIAQMNGAANDPDKPSVYLGSILADDHVPGFAEQNHLTFMSPSIRQIGRAHV